LLLRNTLIEGKNTKQPLLLNVSVQTREAISYIEFVMRIIPMVSKRYQKLALSAENP
jgi:hypothetical protein